jgi:hypothetical protein
MLCLALVVVVACALYAAEEEATKTHKLEYRVVQKAYSDERGYALVGMGSVEEVEAKDQALRAEPKYASERLFRGRLELGADETAAYAVVLDAANGKGPPCDRLYFDANGDRDLTNDPVIKAAKVKTAELGGVMSFFRPLTLELPGETGGPYAVTIMAYYVKECPGCGEEHSYAAAGSACYWEGTVQFGDQTRRVVLLDGECNGLFNERNPSTIEYPYGYGGDQLLVLADGRKPVKLTPDLAAQAMPLGRYVRVGDSFYGIEPAPDGSSLKVATREAPTGILRVNVQHRYRLQLIGEDGPITIDCSTPESRLPVGEYLLREQMVIQTDAKAREWVLETSPTHSFSLLTGPGEETGMGARPGMLEVTADSKPELAAFGPPLVVSLDASVTEEEDEEEKWEVVQIGLSLAGEGGDSVSGILVDGVQPPAPKFRIVSAEGKVVAEEAFEYG